MFVPDAVGRHKRLRAFTKADFVAVAGIISGFQEVACCAHVLAETSNLVSYTNENEAALLRGGLKTLLDGMSELQIASLEAMERPEYLRLGLTDAVIMTLHKSPAHLLTIDLNLTLAAQKAGLDVINYNWFRDPRD